MIVSVVLVVIMILVETLMLPVAGFLITCWWIYLSRGFINAIWAAGIGGILLDILAPRNLGLSSFVVLGVLLVAELTLGKSRNKEEQLVAIGIILIIVEGLVLGRSMLMIMIGVGVLCTLLIGRRILQGSRGGIVVRREI
ncbi:MAG: hypothetical protein WCL07_03635 [bacterium]